MGKTSTKLAVYALVQLLLYHLSGLVGAVEFHFYSRVDHCAGPAVSYRDVRSYSCIAPATVGAVRIRAIRHQMTGFYYGGGCCFMVFRHRGRGCAVGAGYTGVLWFPSRIPNEAEKVCDAHAQTKPTGISYSEESTEGLWILTTDNATEMYTQMDTIPDAQKVDWLQAHGATFQPGD